MTTKPKSQDDQAMTSKRFDPSRFTTSKSKPLPVLLLLDVSASMNEVISGSFEGTGHTFVADGQTWESVTGGETRIEVLNQAVKEMIASFAREEQLDHEILVSVITFGETTRVHLPPTKASQVEWTALTADGQTPLGEAIAAAKQLIEDKETTPSRAYRPVVVLVSDGKPTDQWKANLESFVGTGRSTKCDRMALSIGAGADEDMLRKFIAGTPNPVFHAVDAEQIRETFKRVTMSVTVRSRSKDPNQVPQLEASPVAPAPARGAVAKGPVGESPPKGPGSDDDDDYF
jgi:uncharacterized protein YegL